MKLNTPDPFSKDRKADADLPVWDVFVRTSHWVVVLAFSLAYLTEDDFLLLHSWAGYILFMVVVLRILWGFVGSRHARFSDFVTPPSAVIDFLKDTAKLRPKRFIGHNPAGGAMILMLLLMLLLTASSGMALMAIEEGQGPLAALFKGVPYYWGGFLENIHELCANFTLFLVFIHVSGVLVGSLLHHENLILAMFTGRKQRHTVSGQDPQETQFPSKGRLS